LFGRLLSFEVPIWHLKSNFQFSLHIQLAPDAEFLDAFAQRRARDAGQLRILSGLFACGFTLLE
jgi:hypothetical protein